MTARSFSIPTTVPLTTEPSCRLPWVNDSSSSLAKSSRDGATVLVVAMDSPVSGSCPPPRMPFVAAGDVHPVDVHLRTTAAQRGDRAIEAMIQVRMRATTEAGGAG